MSPAYTLTFLLFIMSFLCFGQQAPLLSKKSKRPNIEIITFDGQQVVGRVADITLDYILLDAKRFNDPAVLSAYYIRNEGKYYKIDVEYIKVAIVASKKKVAASALGGAAAGAIMGGNATPGDDTSDFLAASAAGAGIGTVVGSVKALSRGKQRIPILGNAITLISLLDYYQ